jgi:hypothetical protein
MGFSPGGHISPLFKTIPQGLKPVSSSAVFLGTAKAVPFQNNAFPLFQMRLP